MANPITPGPTSEGGDLATPADFGEDEGAHGDKSDEEQDGEIDEELAAELDMVLGDQGQEGDDDDEDDEDDEDDSDEEEEDEDDEASQSMKLLNEEIRDLTAAVAKKEHEIASSSNPLIKVYTPFSLPRCAFPTSFAAPFRGRLEKAQGRLGDEGRSARRSEGETTPAKRGYLPRRC
jgi:transcription initiation factor TFIID subunit 7